MKFGEHLGSQLTPEWKCQYVNYDELKKFLYEVEENAPSAEESNEEVLQRHFMKHDEEFFVFCDNELRKINTFYAEKLAEALRRFGEIELEVANAGVERLQKVARSTSLFPEEQENYKQNVKLIQKRMKKDKKKLKELKAVVGEYYLSLVLIQNYQQLNFTGFRKILKKHDKMWKTTSGVEYRQKKVENSGFYVNKQIDDLINDTETIAIEDLENGDRSKAMDRLRVPPLHEQKRSDTNTSFLWGFFFGLLVVLMFIVGISGYYKGYTKTAYYHQNIMASTITTTTPTTTVATLPWQQQKHLMTNSTIRKDDDDSDNDDDDDDDDSDDKNKNPDPSKNKQSMTGNNPHQDKQTFHLRWQPAVRMYRGMFLIILMIGLLGVNVHGWGNAGVNHVLIFELDPRHHLNYVELLMLSSFLGVVWCISCIAFLFSNDFNIPVFSNPLACGVFYLIFFLNPTKTFHYRARRWLLRILLRILRAPFCAVRFADFWLADQLNSLVVALRDFQYFFCFYCYDWYNEGNEMCRDPRNIVRPFVAFLPAWFRFAQCLRRYYDTRKGFPHLVNAGKYSTSMTITLISTIYSVYPESDGLFTVWVISLIVGTCYTLFWDLKMDWGLFSPEAGENTFLREQIVYEYRIYYYLAILADLIFRLMWTLTLSIGNYGWVHHEFFTFFIAICEVVRRFIWNYFRLENEHLNNVGEFRAVRDISIKPMVSKDEIKDTLTLEQIMDLEEGPIPRNKAVKYLLDSAPPAPPSVVMGGSVMSAASRLTSRRSGSRKLSSVLKII